MVAHRSNVGARRICYRHVRIDDVLVCDDPVDAHARARDPFQVLRCREGIAAWPAEKCVSVAYRIYVIGRVIRNDELDLRERIAQLVGIVSTNMVGANNNF